MTDRFLGAVNNGYKLLPDITPRLAPPGPVFVPVSARGEFVFDNGGDAICQCFTSELATKVANLLNKDAASAR